MDGGEKITPFRMQILMDVAARVVKVMVSGAWHLTFDEMEIILELVRDGIKESRARNGKE